MTHPDQPQSFEQQRVEAIAQQLRQDWTGIHGNPGPCARIPCILKLHLPVRGAYEAHRKVQP